jgi:hypothetical protein
VGNQDFWDRARQTWADREIADEEVVRLSKLPCLGCARAYPSVLAPLFIHPCVCGEWHRVCAVCVIQGKLVVGNPSHTSTLGRFGLLAKCPYPLRVAREVMGDAEVVEHHPTPRIAPTLKQWDAVTQGEPIEVSDLKVRVTRLH